MVLTEFGQRVFPQIEALLEQANGLQEAVRDGAGLPSGVVKVGVVPSLANSVVPALIALLQKEAPRIRLSIAEGLSTHLDELLASGRIDLAVINRYSRKVPTSEDLLGQVTTYLVCSPTHKYGRLSTVAFSQLEKVPLVVPAAPSGLRSLLDHHAGKLGVSLTIHMEAESLSVMKRVAESGEAMTILPMCAVYDEVQARRLSAVKIVEPELPRLIMLATTQHHALSKATRFLMARTHDLVAPLLEDQPPDLLRT